MGREYRLALIGVSEKIGAVVGEELMAGEAERWSEELDDDSDDVPMLEPGLLRFRVVSTWASTTLKLMPSMPFLVLKLARARRCCNLRVIYRRNKVSFIVRQRQSAHQV